ncbi:MAG: caspase family protein [Rhodospirillales bacterium]|nr:caspase family protein [Rhodospirillales bacterium]
MGRLIQILFASVFFVAPAFAAFAQGEAALGRIDVDFSNPKVYTPDDYDDPWMYYRLLNKPNQEWYLDAGAMVRNALKQSGLFAPSSAEVLNVKANLIELEDYGPGNDIDATMVIRYRLIDSTGGVLINKSIKSEGQATVGEFFSGADRSKLGIQRAVSANLESFLNFLRGELSKGMAALKSKAKPKKISLSKIAKATIPQQPTSAASRFPSAPISVQFKPGPLRPDDIVVIIGNADYGKNIPDVIPAYADAEGIKKYALQALGVREGNIIDLRDASQADMISVFGSESNHRGKLFNWVQPGVSNIFVYYSGHGSPGKDGTAYLVPVDADPSTLHLNGLRLESLYTNLKKIPAKSITVVLEACFSGASSAGSVISNASPVYLKSKAPMIPPGITVFTAGSENQLASWEEDKSHGLFTKYFLLAMSGEADDKPYGNGDGVIDNGELENYFHETITYYARRYYGRDQNVQIVGFQR